MSLHINRFIDKIKTLEAKKAKTFNMTMQEAKDLHSDITKLLIVLNELQQRSQKSEEVTKVEVDGGNW